MTTGNFDDSPPRQISVSRDALRADLAEMELRLRQFIQTEIDKKASISELETIRKEIEGIKKNTFSGDFSPAQILAIKDIIEKGDAAQQKNNWGRKDRLIQILTVIAVTISMVFSALYAINSIDNSPPNTTGNSITTSTTTINRPG